MATIFTVCQDLPVKQPARRRDCLQNDGKLHGLLWLGRISLVANGLTNSGELGLVEFAVEGQCPSNTLCLMTADVGTQA